MTNRNIFLISGTLLIGLVVWIMGRVNSSFHQKFKESSHDENLIPRRVSTGVASSLSDVANHPTQRTRPREVSESWGEFQNFRAKADHQSHSENEGIASYFQIEANTWSRAQLKQALAELRGDGLENDSRSLVFEALLYVFSEKDSEEALAIFDQVQHQPGFNQGGRFLIHRLVMNLADQNPEKACQWLEAHQDRLSPPLFKVMLEKVRLKARE